MFDGKAFGQEVVATVTSYMERTLAPVLERLAAVERKLAEPAPVVAPAEMAAVKQEVAALRKDLAELPKPAELPDIPKMVADAVAAIPPVEPVDMVAIGGLIDSAAAFQAEKRSNASAAAYIEATKAAEAAMDKLAAAEEQARAAREAQTREFTRVSESVAGVRAEYERLAADIDPAIRAVVADAIAALPAPKEFDPTILPPLVAAEVEKAVSGLPKPQDGHSPTAAELDALIEPRVSKAVSVAAAGIPAPKDGCGIKELLIDRDGALVATMDDGRLKSLGVVVGRNGADVDMAAVERRVSEAIAALPVPKDGKDGLGLEDMTFSHEGRNFTVRFARGDLVKEYTFAVPVTIYRGVWKEGSSYQQGDVVTWGGSSWHCDVDGATEKPDPQTAAQKQWTLMVKKGSAGKDLRPDEPKQIPVVKLRKDD